MGQKIFQAQSLGVAVVVRGNTPKLTNKGRLLDDYGQWVCHGANLLEDSAWQGFHPCHMHGLENSAPTNQQTDSRGQRRADRLWKVGEVSRGIEKRPKGRFYSSLGFIN